MQQGILTGSSPCRVMELPHKGVHGWQAAFAAARGVE